MMLNMPPFFAAGRGAAAPGRARGAHRLARADHALLHPGREAARGVTSATASRRSPRGRPAPGRTTLRGGHERRPQVRDPDEPDRPRGASRCACCPRCSRSSTRPAPRTASSRRGTWPTRPTRRATPPGTARWWSRWAATGWSARSPARCAARRRWASLPGGRGNDFARAIGIPQDIPGACKVLLEGVRKALDLGEANGKSVRLHRLDGLRLRGEPDRERGAARARATWSTRTPRSAR